MTEGHPVAAESAVGQFAAAESATAGFAADESTTAGSAAAGSTAAGSAATGSASAGSAESAARWRAVRAVLTANRQVLGRVAAGLYPRTPRAGPSDLLCREGWLPAAPLALDDLPVTWAGDPPPGAWYSAALADVLPVRAPFP